MPVVFVCTEDKELYGLLSYILVAEGYRTRLLSRVADLSEIDASEASLVLIMDVASRPVELCRSLNRLADRHPLKVLALVDSEHGSHLLDVMRPGIAECLVRPLNVASMLELVRKAACMPEKRKSPFTPQVLVDPLERTVSWMGRVARLSPIEFELFMDLYRHVDKVRSRNDLLVAAGQAERPMSQRNIDVHICRLRRGLKPLGDNLIRTVSRSGYKLCIPAEVMG